MRIIHDLQENVFFFVFTPFLATITWQVALPWHIALPTAQNQSLIHSLTVRTKYQRFVWAVSKLFASRHFRLSCWRPVYVYIANTPGCVCLCFRFSASRRKHTFSITQPKYTRYARPSGSKSVGRLPQEIFIGPRLLYFDPHAHKHSHT